MVEPVAAAAETRKPPRPALDSVTGGGKTPLDPGGVLGKIGFPGMDQILYAAAILESMPQPLRDAAHGPYGARAVVYAVLLGSDAAVRARQLDSLRAKAEPASYQETGRLIPLVDGLPGPARLPLVETAFPALRQLSPEQYKTFRETVEVMIHEDNQIDLLEYTIRTMLLRGLDVHFGLAKPVAVAYRRMEPMLPSLVAVFSALAYAGQNEDDAARAAFTSGMSQVGLTASLAARADCSLRSFDAAAQSARRRRADAEAADPRCLHGLRRRRQPSHSDRSPTDPSRRRQPRPPDPGDRNAGVSVVVRAWEPHS